MGTKHLLDLPDPLLTQIIRYLPTKQRFPLTSTNRQLSKLAKEAIYHTLYITDIQHAESTHSTYLFPFQTAMLLITPAQLFKLAFKCLTAETEWLVKSLYIDIHDKQTLHFDDFLGIMNFPIAKIEHCVFKKGSQTVDELLNWSDLLPCFNFRSEFVNRKSLYGIENTVKTSLILNTIDDYYALVKKLECYEDTNMMKRIEINRVFLNLSPGLNLTAFTNIFSLTKIDFKNVVRLDINCDNYEFFTYLIGKGIKLINLKHFNLHYIDSIPRDFCNNLFETIPFQQLTSFHFKFEISSDTLIPVTRIKDNIRCILLKNKKLFVDYVNEVIFSRAIPLLSNLDTLSISIIGINVGEYADLVNSIISKIPSKLSTIHLNTHGSCIHQFYKSLQVHSQTLHTLTWNGPTDDSNFWVPSSSLQKSIHHYYGLYLKEVFSDIDTLPAHLKYVDEEDATRLVGADLRTSVSLYTDINSSSEDSQYAIQLSALIKKRAAVDWDLGVLPKVDCDLKYFRYVKVGLKGLVKDYPKLKDVTINGLKYIVQDGYRREPVLVSD